MHRNINCVHVFSTRTNTQSLLQLQRMSHGKAAFVLAIIAATQSFANDVERKRTQDKKIAKSVPMHVSMLWPTPIIHVSLSSLQERSLESPDFGDALRDLGLQGFDKYERSILPKELSIDRNFAAAFADADHSRINTAFGRWQARAYSNHFGLPIKRFSVQGQIPPELDGVPYGWPELYNNPRFRRLLLRVKQLSKVYLNRTGWDTTVTDQTFFIIPWVEVFRHGDAYRPQARSDGAYIFSRYFASVKTNSLKFNTEDTRGINPPFGKTHSMPVESGEIVMLPPWTSTLITPNMINETSVCYCFMIYPESGKLPVEDDLTASVKFQSRSHVVPKSNK
eukprot:TRINITY_DN26957_c0_g1_i1.p1 TRINITY_DN26957_c0_g1~~TRINITY_DN26957_c0_g1_i1.p1  ORF type:complete len:337 (+),score=26.02 TRINITY_DN26957_c0_g1_i1:272-1282(+)